MKSKIAKGINPLKKQDKIDSEPLILPTEEFTFKELFDKYINDCAKHNIKRWKDYIATMDRQGKPFYNMKISDIQRTDIQRAFNELTDAGKLLPTGF